PHGSDVAGSLFATTTAGRLYNAGSIRLFTKGALNVIWRPPLQAGEANAVKSPAIIAGVGTYAGEPTGFWRNVKPWYPVKKKALSCRMGPPMVPPNWLRFRESRSLAK